jgi:hypothetical protein
MTAKPIIVLSLTRFEQDYGLAGSVSLHFSFSILRLDGDPDDHDLLGIVRSTQC